MSKGGLPSERYRAEERRARDMAAENRRHLSAHAKWLEIAESYRKFAEEAEATEAKRARPPKV
jgi:hypothetical protein